jgi:tight adherence protein C
MSPTDRLLGYAGIALVAAAIGVVVFVLGRTTPTRSPRLGLRGLKRQQALAAGGPFALIEPIVRFVAAFVAYVPMPSLRRALETKLTQAGDVLGLTPEEYVAASALSSAGALTLAFMVRDAFGSRPLFFLAVGVLGALLPHFRLGGEIERRQHMVDRSIPVAIDLAALSMGAGLDFPGALKQILEKAISPDEPLHEEFSRIVQVLELGRTRSEALETFAERIPTEAVRDFACSVIQAEAKGNPLANVLRIQARMLRMRRSVDAEKAASRAGVMMMIPMLLMFGSIILVLLGPFIVNGMKSGF